MMMSPEQQRIAIAEACGWTWETRKHPAPCWHKGDFFTNAPLFYEPRRKESHYHDLPDYLNDLNAMREAIAGLRGRKARWPKHDCDTDALVVFGWHLAEILNLPECDIRGAEIAAIALASPSELAEAFLRTLNLWVETPA